MRKETKATKIPEKTKKAVWERDGWRCVVCLRPGNPWCHFIPRSQGGLGIEQNIVTLCDKCHNDFDQTEKRKHMQAYIRWYRQILMPSHRRADSSGYVMEHIAVWERETGLEIPENCVIHHLNGVKDDNRIENLSLMERGAHTILHHTGTHLSEETKSKISNRRKTHC